MSLADLTPESVRQAIAEFDRVGRSSFLRTYGFGRARGYFLIHNGQPYDSKAIAGVAHQYLLGHVALTNDEFSGGEEAAAGKLRELGFEIKGPEEHSPKRRHSSPVASTIASAISTMSMAANDKGASQRRGRHL